jgi:hypothetical protein
VLKLLIFVYILHLFFFGLFCVKVTYFCIKLSVKRKLRFVGKLELKIYITCVCEEYGHVDVWVQQSFSNIGHPFPPPVTLLSGGYPAL